MKINTAHSRNIVEFYFEKWWREVYKQDTQYRKTCVFNFCLHIGRTEKSLNWTNRSLPFILWYWGQKWRNHLLELRLRMLLANLYRENTVFIYNNAINLHFLPSTKIIKVLSTYMKQEMRLILELCY